MANRCTDTFSVTYRPPDGELPDPEEFEQWLQSNTKWYIFSIEKNNHFQCAIKIEGKNRTDKIRNKLKSLWPKATTISLVVKNHNDWLYAIGYCCKEAPPVHNLSETELKNGITHYENRISVKNRIKSKSSNMDEIALFIKDHFITNNIPLAEYEVQRALKIVRDSLPFSVYQRINKLSLLGYISLWKDEGAEGGEATPSRLPGTPIHICTSERKENVHMGPDNIEEKDLLDLLS